MWISDHPRWARTSVRFGIDSAAAILQRSQHLTAVVQRLLLTKIAVGLLAITIGSLAFDGQRMLAAAQAYGARAVAGATSLHQLITQGSRATDESRVRATNQFFNDTIQFVSDEEVWGQADYWASPLEMLGKGAGDCEDFAMGKYFSLLAMGMPPSRLRMVYVKAMLDGPGGQAQAHMVVAYYPAPGAEPLILDNLATEVLPASRRADLIPVFSFNSEGGVWNGVSGQGTPETYSRLSKWRGALARSRAQGF
ncbi:MAG: transglutaminase-like cysteine peptidase [Ideonella sp.]